jgi:short-subunit dehydrogenase
VLKILIVGATSAIAHETARRFAREGAKFFLVGRSADKLAILKDDLLARGAAIAETYELDMTEKEQQRAMFDAAIQALDGLDALIVAHGTLTDQKAAQDDAQVAMHELDINFLSTVPVLTYAANLFEQQRRGAITVISSVAGDRGRGSNYVYGSAMAAKTAFTSGLRNRLAKVGVPVLTVKPGFVDTPMTADVKKNFLFASASDVGQAIYDAMKKGRDVLYTPIFWRGIMAIIRSVPEPIFKRLGL